MRLLLTIWVVFLLCGCNLPKRAEPVPKHLRNGTNALLLPPMPPTVALRSVAAVVPPVEVLLTNISIGVNGGKLGGNGTLLGFAHDNKFFMFNRAHQYFDLTLTNGHITTSDGASTIVQDRLLVADSVSPYLGVIHEYQLLGPATAPTAAKWVWSMNYAPNGRSHQALTLSNGGAVVETVPAEATYQAHLVYRRPDGQKLVYHEDFKTPRPPGTVSRLAEGSNGIVCLFITCDSSQVVSLARWRADANGLTFLDWRYSFLPAAGITPDYEFPTFEVATTPDKPGMIYGSVSDAADSHVDCEDFGWWRWCRHSVFEVDTDVPDVAPKVYSWKVDYQNLFVEMDTLPDWELAVTTNLVNWIPVTTVYYQYNAKGHTFVQAANPLYQNNNYPLKQYFLRSNVKPYKIRPIVMLPDYCERVLSPVQLWPTGEDLFYATAPKQPDCNWNKLYFRKCDYTTGALTDVGPQPTGYGITAWGNGLGGGYAVIQRNGQYFIRRMI